MIAKNFLIKNELIEVFKEKFLKLINDWVINVIYLVLISIKEIIKINQKFIKDHDFI